MLEIKTYFRLLTRRTREAVSGFIAQPGVWAYIDSNGRLANIPNDSTTQDQPEMLRLVMTKKTASQYESHEIKQTTAEALYEAKVDTDGYQKYCTDGSLVSYTEGVPLTPAYRIAPAPSSESKYSLAADIGKLRPATWGDMVVAITDKLEAGELHFSTVSPKPYGGDDVWYVVGTGHLISKIEELASTTGHQGFQAGNGDLNGFVPISDGVGAL